MEMLHVFGGPKGGGNALAVVLDGDTVAPDERQGMARELGYSETVFVDDPHTGRVQIFTPAAELPFAGHPLVGTAWLLERHGYPADMLRPPAGEVLARREHGLSFEEDEATGAAAMLLGAELGRALEIHQGRGSVIHATPLPDGRVEIGGRVR